MSRQRETVENLTGLSDEERQIERLLAALAPRDSGINRDRTMFLAGQASASSQAPRSPNRHWICPAITVCSAAAGLLAGVLIASSQSPPIVARPTPQGTPVAQRLIGVERRTSDREASLVDSPGLLELRVAMSSRAGDEFLLTRVDPLVTGQPLEPGVARAAGPFAPMTYGAFLGRQHEEEKHL